jgi:hypothetical protein
MILTPDETEAPDETEEDEAWEEMSKRHFLEAYDDHDGIYDQL